MHACMHACMHARFMDAVALNSQAAGRPRGGPPGGSQAGGLDSATTRLPGPTTRLPGYNSVRKGTTRRLIKNKVAEGYISQREETLGPATRTLYIEPWAQLQESLGPVFWITSNMSRSHVGHLLDMSGIRFGHVRDTSWHLFGHVWYMCWTCLEYSGFAY